MSDEPVVTLKSVQRKGEKYPVLHVLMSDGRATEFKDTAVVVPRDTEADGNPDVFAILVNREGVPYVNMKGEIAVHPLLPFALATVTDPNRVWRLEDIVTMTGLSLSTVKRAVTDGELTGKVKLGKRAVGFKASDVEKWFASRTP